MMSAFASREFGFGIKLSNKELEKVNEFCEDKSYVDKAAAIYLLGSRKNINPRN